MTDRTEWEQTEPPYLTDEGPMVPQARMPAVPGVPDEAFDNRGPGIYLPGPSGYLHGPFQQDERPTQEDLARMDREREMRDPAADVHYEEARDRNLVEEMRREDGGAA